MMRHRVWIQGAAGCALLATAVIAIGLIALHSWINSMVPQTLTATVLPPGDRLALRCEDAQGRSLEIREVASDPVIRVAGGPAIPLSSPRLSDDGRVIEYDLPERAAPGARMVLDAPAGWASAADGPLPAFSNVEVSGLSRQGLVAAQPKKGSKRKPSPRPTPSRREIQNPSTFAFQSARVTESGRAIEVAFAADARPDDPGTLVDRRLSAGKTLAIQGDRVRTSASLAGVSVSRGRSEFYLLSTAREANGYGASKALGTRGETLTFRSGETVIGTIPPFEQDADHPDAVAFLESELRRILDAIPVEDVGLVDRWEFLPLVKTADGDPPRSYKLAVSDGQTTLTTGPIDYDTSKQGYTGDTAAEALRAVLGDRAVSGWNYYNYPLRAQLVFEREHCPIWPIRSIAVVEPSEPDLLGEPVRVPPYLLEKTGGSGWQYAIRLRDGLGARNLDLSIASDGPIFDGCLSRWIAGDDRWLWTATWYLDDPTEVVTLGETITLSGPAGLLAGAVVDPELGDTAPTGDQTAAFADQPVTNRSRAGADGKLSGDLCRPRPNPEGISDGWARWRREAPPASWIPDDPRSGAGLDLPIRIAYLDPTYDGSNGPARLNDPSRPYASIDVLGKGQPGHYDLNGPTDAWNAGVMATPRLILIKKGTHATIGGSTVLYNVLNGAGVSHESPAIVSSYWMDADGPEPEDPAILEGQVFHESNANAPGGCHDLVIHGLEWRGSLTTRTSFRDLAIWECDFPPFAAMPTVGSIAVDFQGVSARFSMVRTKVYDAWKVSGSAGGMYVRDVYQGHLDQTTWIRNGYTNFPGGWNGELWGEGDSEATQPTFLGSMSDITAMPAAHDLALSHHAYIQSCLCTPWLVTNNFGLQSAGVAFMARVPVIFYANAHDHEGDFAQAVMTDDCLASRHGSHLRRNLFARTVQNAPIQIDTHGYGQAGGSLAVLVEDNLILGPVKVESATAIGIRVVDLNATSSTRTILARHNTIVDQWIQWGAWPLADGRLAPDLRVATLRNLLVRTSRPTESPVLYYPRWTPPGPAGLSWLTANHDLFAVPAAATTTFAWSLQDNATTQHASLDDWRAATGLEADGLRSVLTIATPAGPIDGSADPFVTYLASRLPSVATWTDALHVLRDRRPEEWDDTLHAPLGDGTPTGGLIGFAESALTPTNLDGVGSGPYGAVDYTKAVGPAEVSPSHAVRPPRITPRQLAR